VIGLYADDYLRRLGCVFCDQCVETGNTLEALWNSALGKLCAIWVLYVNVVMTFCPVIANEYQLCLLA
jgi:hypothetical protein